jgi:hypothetical protein
MTDPCSSTVYRVYTIHSATYTFAICFQSKEDNIDETGRERGIKVK